MSAFSNPSPESTRDGSPRPNAAVVVDNLHQRYGNFEAVRGVSFDIVPGELFALLGTNGAGKTTTVEALEGFRRPSSGTVRVLGIDPYDQPRGLRERTNAVLQGSGLLDDLTVTENLTLAADLAAQPRPVGELLELVGLAERHSVRVRQLSGGEKRRLDLATALVTRPEVVYLDEPTSGLDPEGRHETWDIIGSLKDEGVAVLLTTHYLDEAERLADRLAIMHRGEIRASGTLDEVLAQWGDQISFRLPASVSTADLPVLEGCQPKVESHDDGSSRIAYTIRGQETEDRAYRAVAELVTWAAGRGASLGRLRVHSASLEDVFLQVVSGAEKPH